MRRVLLLIMASLFMLACGNSSNAETARKQTKPAKDYVEVLLFHGKQRCITCRAIEQHAKELVESKFAEQMKQGKDVMRVIDFSKKENEALAEKYQVSFSSLIVVQHKNGKEKADDMTEFAFSNARSNLEKFKSGLQQRIILALK